MRSAGMTLHASSLLRDRTSPSGGTNCTVGLTAPTVRISLPESRKVALEAFGVSPPYGAPRGPELAPAARGVGMGPRLNATSAQFTYFDVHTHTDTPQTGPSAV